MKYVFLLFLLFCTSFEIKAQPSFISKNLYDIYLLLPKDVAKNILAVETQLSCSLRGYPLLIKIEKNNSGQITHLGLPTNNIGIDSVLPVEFKRFMERKFLEYFLINDMKKIVNINQQNKILMSLNGESLGSLLFSSFDNIIPILSDIRQFSVNRDSLTYSMRLSGSDNQVFDFIFPANQMLICGMDKKELDDNLVRELKLWRSSTSPVPIIGRDQLVPIGNGIYKLPGKTYYSILFSDLFFEKQDTDNFELLFGTADLSKSFSNGLLRSSELCSKKTARITQNMYGKKEEQYTIMLTDLTGYYTTKGFELYFGIEDSLESNLRGTLIAYNRSLNFLDLMDIRTNSEELFNPMGDFRIRLYSNIPTDNIKDLFGRFLPEE